MLGRCTGRGAPGRTPSKRSPFGSDTDGNSNKPEGLGASQRVLAASVRRGHGSGVIAWLGAGEAVCRGLMLRLHREGHLQLPPARRGSKQPLRHAVVAHVEVPATPRVARLADLGRLDIRQVRRTSEEALVKSLVEQHQYLGYAHPVGEHLKYLVSAGGQPIACFCWSSAARHLGPRDRYIGWSKEQRKARIRFVA
jgi:hypothetical protein